VVKTVSSGSTVRPEVASSVDDNTRSITDSIEIEEHKRLFYLNAQNAFANSIKIFSQSKYLEIVESMKSFDSKPHRNRSCLDYRWQRSYILLLVPDDKGEKAILVRRKDHSDETQVKVMRRLAYIDSIRYCHVEEGGHPGPRGTHEDVWTTF